jgi:hypothetical protein
MLRVDFVRLEKFDIQTGRMPHMSTPEHEAKTNNIDPKKFRGIFTLVMLAFAAAAGGCYFAIILK